MIIIITDTVPFSGVITGRQSPKNIQAYKKSTSLIFEPYFAFLNLKHFKIKPIDLINLRKN